MQELWQAYFKGDHDQVLTTTHARLFETQAPDLMHLSGLSLLAKGDTVEGVSRLRCSLVLYAGSANWFSNAAIASLNAGSAEESLSFATEGLTRFPEDSLLHYAHGNALTALNRHVEAEASYDRALAIKPDMIDATLNKGNCLRRTDRNTEALVCYERVLAADPLHAPATINRLGILLEQGRHLEAEPILTRFVKRTAMPEAEFMLSMLRLHDGNYLEGWKLYRSRWTCAMALADSKHFAAPRADTLADITGKAIVVSHEQGFGDSLQFVRFLPQIAAVASHTTLQVPEPLLRLFQHSYGHVPNVTVSEQRPEHYDFEVPMLDMPALLGTTLDSLPDVHPYLGVDLDLVEKLALPPTTAKLRVGLVWAGQCRENPDLAAVDRRRSMSLDQMGALAQVPGVEFVSLQMGDTSSQGNTPPEGMVLKPGVRTGYDFLDTAAIMQQLDLMIAVDTAPLHLAAALGVPTWVLSRFDGCWRWLRGKDDSPWYPTARLFRQPTPGDWESVMQDVADALSERAR